MKDLKELFNVEKPILGMVHFLPLPGSPLYDHSGGMKKILDTARRDCESLVNAGFDGVSFSNEGDRPYLSDVSKTTVAAMSYLIGEVSRDLEVPFGLSVLSDSEAAISIGTAVNADFVRIFLSWVFVGDWGIVNPNAGKLQRAISNVDSTFRVFANISGHTEPLGGRKIEDIARGAIKFGLADAVCLAGTTAGSEIAEDDLINARKGADGSPVIVGTGTTMENVERMLELGDGVIMGTSIKVDRNTFNPVDPEAARRFMQKARHIREKML
ncbi:MAG TPA: BtpA/SgcQ family protein [Thermotogota bacterium]|nr:BtpA/SgcQ family protein [Thermotogota bacterium]HPJ89848.1 BtpA/SgcQ family protein [Thermotogota bacterium]HPR95921.1 BtpA/SgcQ family protein [Thermotogota bacterium]